MSVKTTRSGRTIKPLKRMIDEEDESSKSSSSSSPAKRPRRQERASKIQTKSAKVEQKLAPRKNATKNQTKPSKLEQKEPCLKKTAAKNQAKHSKEEQKEGSPRKTRTSKRSNLDLISNGEKTVGKSKKIDKGSELDKTDKTEPRNTRHNKAPKRAVRKRLEEAQIAKSAREDIDEPQKIVSELKQNSSENLKNTKQLKSSPKKTASASNQVEEELNDPKALDGKSDENHSRPKMSTRTKGKTDKASQNSSKEDARDIKKCHENKNEKPKNGNKALKKNQIAQMLHDESDEEEEEEKEEELIEASPVKKKPPSKSKRMTEKNNQKPESDDTEVSFNFPKFEKKKPIYMRKPSPSKKPKEKYVPDDDPYEIYDEYQMGSSDEDDSKKAKNKKKKVVKRKPRKQKAGMILAFDSNKTQIAQMMKKIKNLQTPPSQTGLGIIPKKVLPPRIAISPAPSISQKPKTPDTNRPTANYDTHRPILQEDINTQEDDDVNFVNDDIGYDDEIPITEVPPKESTANEDVFYHPGQKSYKTPIVSRRMTKMVQDRKASTPRVEEAAKPPTKETMIKNCFGFDDSLSQSESEKSTRESLEGFSPVQKVVGKENNHLIVTPGFTATRDRPRKPGAAPPSSICKPMRFQFKMPKVRTANSSSSTSQNYKKGVHQKSKSSQPMTSSRIDSNLEVTLFDELPTEDESARDDLKSNVNQDINEDQDILDGIAFEVKDKGKGKAKKTAKKPLKTVTNTKAVKQSLITDHTHIR